jgi:hypothetical protein
MNYKHNNRLKILILYDKHSTFTNTVREYLESFSIFSQHYIFYAHATNDAKCKLDLNLFDVIIIHYSVRLCYNLLSLDYVEAISKFSGFKVFFVQDEYDYTETTRTWIENLAINVVFSCVPPEYIDLVYPSSRFPDVEFKSIITGFVPIYLENKTHFKPFSERKIYVGYRGRELAYWYGNLAREKLIIGQEMRKICEKTGINCDIEWEETKRIYGEEWYEFIQNCRATLGTESGSNIFDDYGNIRKTIQMALQINPAMSYKEIHDNYMAEQEGKIMMNQISPRVFEAIALKTALILFEGNYSGIIKPDVHYIPLKKDFSNIEDVLSKLDDQSYLEKLTDQAYQDIIFSGQYSYKNFIQEFDEFISQRVTSNANISSFVIHEVQEAVQEADIENIINAIKLGYLTNQLIKQKIKKKFPAIWQILLKCKQVLYQKNSAQNLL